MARVKRKSSKSRQLPLSVKSVERTPVAEFAERAYLNYSMYVILDRALPHLSDGLKPVQRRIIYAMSELSLKHPNKPKKSARTIGDVIGKFHPHGDSACYEAMVLMAQPFSYRYPLIQGQGNWGSYDDPKSFAAMRYTESRLTPYCETLLAELPQGTVKWQSNFDGTLYEPETFPARLPNILLNGTTGIAVGISTDIPPHNLTEIGTACVALLKNSRLSESAIIQLIHAPDYPTGGEIITPLEEVHRIYKQGNGTLRLRATYSQGSNQITITSLPHGVSTSRVMDEILNQIKNNKHLGIKGIRDESDEEVPIRLTIITKRGIDAEALMLHLFATTNLEKTCRINLNVIDLDGRPKILGIAEILKRWIVHRCDVVQVRLRWRQNKIVERREILQGLLVAYLNIDQVIHTIRTADNPESALMKKFKLTQLQASSILSMRLKQLNKLEEIAINKEDQALQEELRKIVLTLSSKQRLRTLIRKEIEQDVKQHQDKRRTQIAQRKPAIALKASAVQTVQPLRVVLSRQSWVFADKCQRDEKSSINYRRGDGALCTVYGQSDQNVFFIDAQGRSYCTEGNDLLNSASRGEPLSIRFKVDGEANFVSAIIDQPKSQWLMASSAGYGFVTELENLYSRNRAGRKVINLPKNARSLPAMPFYDVKGALIVAITSAGYMLAINPDEVPYLAKGKGVKLINLPKASDEYMRYAVCIRKGDTLRLQTGKKFKKLSYDDVSAHLGVRARRGRVLKKQWRNVESVEII